MTDRPLFVIGAGADKSLGFPLMNDLMFELRKFKDGDGKGVHDELRKHVKGLQFDFDKYAGEKGSTMGSILLGGDGSTLTKVKEIVSDAALTPSEHLDALKLVVDRLDRIRQSNDFSDDDRKIFVAAAGSDIHITVDHLIDPSNVKFSDIPRRVLRDALKAAIQETSKGRSELYGLLLSLSNFEELLGEFFTGFFTRNATLQQRYFYLAWLFWAYIRVCEARQPDVTGSFYETLQLCGDFDVITFNYTQYAKRVSAGRAKYFHGDNDVILDFGTRELERTTGLKDMNSLQAFLSSLSCQFGAVPQVKIPGLVPPLIMKPILASEYLDWWHDAATLIGNANTIVIVGYSFAYADEHFNDLVRKRAQRARIIAIDPYWDSVCENVCRVTDTEITSLVDSSEHGMLCRKGGRLAFYREFSDKISTAQLRSIVW